MLYKVIFDIDGVIADSEQLHFDVLYAVVPEQTTKVSAAQLIGLSLDETLDYLGIAKPLHQVLKQQISSCYQQKLSESYLRPGVIELVLKLQESAVEFGFVSTAPRDICLANLALLPLAKAPQLISGDDVNKTKPFPDPYLEIITRNLLNNRLSSWLTDSSKNKHLWKLPTK